MFARLPTQRCEIAAYQDLSVRLDAVVYTV
jgi:hypothetical protein